MPPDFVSYVLNIINADSSVRIIHWPDLELEGVTQLHSPPTSVLSKPV